MKERPILFSRPMSLAVRRSCDPKTQTRRVCKARRRYSLFAHDVNGEPQWTDSYILDPGNEKWRLEEAPCLPGDVLWVRENFRLEVGAGKPAESDGSRVFYEADAQISRDGPILPEWAGKLHPGIHLPRWACRTLLRCTALRVERLHSCNAADAEAEGVVFETADPPFWYVPDVWPHSLTGVGLEEASGPVPRQVRSYAKLWDHINGNGAWAKNPLVWVITFERI